jgi:hypothetical protein
VSTLLVLGQQAWGLSATILDLIFNKVKRHSLSRLGTHYLCRSSEGLDDRLELKVIDKEEEMGDGKAGEAEDDGSEVG